MKQKSCRALTVPVLLLVAFLVMSGMVAAMPKAHAIAITETVIVPRDFFQSIPIDALSNTTLEYSTESNVTISAAFMTSSQFSSFNKSRSGVSNSLFYQNGTRS